MKRLTVLILGLLTLSGQAQTNATDYEDLFPDTWVATDGVGRVAPTSADVPQKTDGKRRTVGVFYVTWHTQGLHNGEPYKCDVTKVLDQDPGASRNDKSPAWTGFSYHWGEPEYGYFLSQDDYVIRHDMSMLADAGVDLIILDVTNAALYWDEWDVIFRTMDQMKKEGNKVPQFCFWAFNGRVVTVVQNLYERYYKTPQYQDLWFYWDGKPLLLYNATPSLDANPNGGEQGVDYSQEVKDFFTLRNMWWGYYDWGGKPYIGEEDKWTFGQQLNDDRVSSLTPQERTSQHQGRMEEFSVTPAQHPMSMVGKSWRVNTQEPELNEKDMPEKAYVPYLDEIKENPVQYGIYFQDRWDEALQVDPDFIYLNDWNEWTAGKYKNGKDPSGQADFHMSFMGRDDNPFYFVDQYNAEFNRTISPARGSYGDNYYMQMAENIRRYKGVRPIPVNHGFTKASVDGRFEEWQTGSVSYRDTRGDVIHRDHDGYGGLHYTNNTGRNDIVLSKVSLSRRNIFFYAQTAEALTPDTDNNWMLLFIDADRNKATGWNGYDYVVNYKPATGSTAYVQASRLNKWLWQEAGKAHMKVAGNRLMLAIPREVLNMAGKRLDFEFKWSDNMQDEGNIMDFYVNGDVAPGGRFNYVYTE